MNAPRFFEMNLARILGSGARRASGAACPASVVDAGAARCLAALRPRHRWPENTRAYACLRARLAVNPMVALSAAAALTGLVLYLSLGPEAATWLGSLLDSRG